MHLRLSTLSLALLLAGCGGESGDVANTSLPSQAEWRLPNIKELVSLTEMACFGPAMNSRAFAQALSMRQAISCRIYGANHPI